MLPSTDRIAEAATLIAPWVRRTPVVEIDGTWLKLELLQHAGSFKSRGAFTTVLSAPQRPAALVAASGGNHGLAVAHVGHALGIATRVFVPRIAAPIKVAAIGALGAEVVQVGENYAAALAASHEAAAAPGAMALHAYDAPDTVRGQGTLGAELLAQVPDLDTVLVAVGGGGLFAGIAAALAGRVRLVAVEPQRCPTLHAALAAGAPVDVEVGGVAADALGASRIGAHGFAAATAYAVESVLVADETITQARAELWRRARIAAEPAGATAWAALRSGAYRPQRGERVAVVVCGGNADPGTLA